MTVLTLPVLKLPRQLEATPAQAAIESVLRKDLRPIWEKSEHRIAHVSFSQALETALIQARNFKDMELGLENIDRILMIEKKGISALAEKQGTPPALRISRLLITANDGSERFYRACEKTLLLHSERLLFLCVDVASARLGERLFGPNRSVKALLVSDKAGVSHTLLSLAGVTT